MWKTNALCSEQLQYKTCVEERLSHDFYIEKFTKWSFFMGMGFRNSIPYLQQKCKQLIGHRKHKCLKRKQVSTKRIPSECLPSELVQDFLRVSVRNQKETIVSIQAIRYEKESRNAGSCSHVLILSSLNCKMASPYP